MAEQKKISDPVGRFVLEFIQESKTAKWTRMQQNQANFESFNLRGDYSHKRRGQSKEFLPKQKMATEQIASFLQQGLVEIEKWFDVLWEDGVTPGFLTKDDLYKILKLEMDRNKPVVYASDSIKLGLLGSLMITKVTMVPVKKTRFQYEKEETEARGRLIKIDNNYYQLKLDLVRQEDYYPDPTGMGLMEAEAIDMDWYKLVQIAEENPDIYDVAKVKSLHASQDPTQEWKKSREKDQNQPLGSLRKMVRIFECYGTFLKEDGTVLIEDGVCAVTEEGVVIRPPAANRNWHGQSPYVAAPIVRIPKSVWHYALMDASTAANNALNELFNLGLDGGLMEVWGIKQIREDWLEDPSQVSEGIAAGDTLRVTNKCPPGMKALERVDTGTVTQPYLNMYGLVDREFQAASLTNDVRMGNLPQRSVKATEIVASNQTITGIFNGIVKMVETDYFSPVLLKALLTIMQHLKKMNPADLEAAIGKERAVILQQMPEEEIFAQVANGAKVRTYGLSTVLNRVNDFRKIVTLMQTIAGSPDLVQAFKSEYSFPRMLGEIVKSLDFNEMKIKLSPQEKEAQAAAQAQQQQMLMALAAKENAGKNPNVPDAGKMSERSASDDIQPEIQEGLSTGEVF